MVRLRPYYLYTILRQLAAGDEPVEDNSIPEITARLVAGGFRDDIQLVRTFCDACRGGPRMAPHPGGCLWGEGSRCTSAETPKRLNQVEDQMRSILYDLELRFADTMRADELICRAIERRPYHYFHIPEWQQAYESGARRFAEITGLRPRISDEWQAERRYYLPEEP